MKYAHCTFTASFDMVCPVCSAAVPGGTKHECSSGKKSPASSPDGRLPGIHGGCRCDRSHWRVVHYHEHRSAFAGYRSTWSEYSRVKCELCLHTWRTKAKYVDSLPMIGGGRAVGEKSDV